MQPTVDARYPQVRSPRRQIGQKPSVVAVHLPIAVTLHAPGQLVWLLRLAADSSEDAGMHGRFHLPRERLPLLGCQLSQLPHWVDDNCLGRGKGLQQVLYDLHNMPQTRVHPAIRRARMFAPDDRHQIQPRLLMKKTSWMFESSIMILILAVMDPRDDSNNNESTLRPKNGIACHGPPTERLMQA